MVVWGVSSFDWFANRIGTDIERYDTDAGDVPDAPNTPIDRPGG
jgi:hypothetical protein